jgi:GTP-binding protein
VTQLLGVRRGIMAKIDHTGGGRVRMEFRVPSRGLIGFRSHFLTETRGTATMNTLFDGWAPWHGAIPAATNGAMVLRPRRHGRRPTPSSTCRTAACSSRRPGRRLRGHGRRRVLARRRPRGERLPREEAHEHARSGHDEAVRLVPHREMGLEDALSWIDDDELVEVTPDTVRIRKRELRSAFRPRGMRSKPPIGPPPASAGQ